MHLRSKFSHAFNSWRRRPQRGNAPSAAVPDDSTVRPEPAALWDFDPARTMGQMCRRPVRISSSSALPSLVQAALEGVVEVRRVDEGSNIEALELVVLPRQDRDAVGELRRRG